MKIQAFVHYQGIDKVFAISEAYSLGKTGFGKDFREIPLAWAQKAITCWIEGRKGEYFSAPFDGVYDFNLLVNGKPRRP